MDFSTMTPQEAMAAASRDLGLHEDFFDRMWKQESGRGTNMKSPKNARGHFQVMPPEHAEMNRRFKREMNPDNFVDSLSMAHNMMGENLRRFKDGRAATAAYNGGWEPKRWGNEETKGYVAALWAQAPAAPVREGMPPAFGVVPGQKGGQQIATEQAAQFKVEQDTGVLDAFQTATRDPRVTGLVGLIEHSQKPAASPTWSYYDKAGDYRKTEAEMRDSTELEFLRENSTSAEGKAWALDQIKQRREMDKTYANAGGAATFVAQGVLGVADPVGWVLGAGVGKAANMARIGHAAFAAKGSRAGVAAAVLAEGAAGNVLWEAFQDDRGEVKTTNDYLMAAGFGGVFSTLAMRGALRGVDAETGRVLRESDDSARAVEADNLVRKADEMEAGRTPEDIGRRQADEIVQQRESALRQTGDEDVAVPRDLADDLRRADDGEPNGLVEEMPAEPTAAQPMVDPLDAQTPGDTRAQVAADEAIDPDDIEFDLGLIMSGPSDNSLAFPSIEASLIDAAKAPGVAVPEDALDAIARHIRSGDNTAARLSAVETVQKMRAAAAPTAPIKVDPGDAPRATVREALDAMQASPAASAAHTAGARQESAVFRAVSAWMQKNLPIDVLTTPVNFGGNNVRGNYNGIAREIDSPGSSARSMPTRDGHGRNPALIFLHETLHAATAKVLRAVEIGAKDVPEIAKQSYQRLDELRKDLDQHLRDKGLRKEGRQAGADYAVKNIHEFASQAITDLETKSALATLPGRGYQAANGLDAVVRGLLGLLGLKPKSKRGTTAADEAAFHIEQLIRVGAELPKDIVPDAEYIMTKGPMSATIDRAFSERMYAHAAAFGIRNPIDPTKLKVLAQTALAKGSAVRNFVLSDGLKMASSNNDIIRMMSGLITETTTGAAGRRTTAAIKRDMLHQLIVGRGVVDYHHAYGDYRARMGGTAWEDFRHGDHKKAFDRAVYEELLARRYGHASHQDPAVVGGADAMEALYQRSLDTQKGHSTLGSGLLPPDAIGYVPQSLDGDRLANATAQELEELGQHMSRHWSGVYGWTKQFTDEFARVYIDGARKRANGNTGIDPVATESPSAAVRDTLEEMRLQSRTLSSTVAAELERVGAQSQNKKRLDVDLLATLPSGKRVIDYYSTDIEVLARTHANRVAGASALADFNVLGQRGVNNIMMAVDLAPEGQRAMPEEREALARVFSEFLGVPVAGEFRSKLATNLTGFVRLQRLGGLAFTQLSELANMSHHLGLASTFKAVGMLPEKVREVRALKKGQAINSPWLGSSESLQGFEFGMAGYTMVARLDPPDELLRAYGKGPDLTTRAVSMGNHLQASLSLFRGLHAAQHRATAELILRKAVEVIEAGGNHKMLEDMGISAQLAQSIKGDLPRAVQRDAAGVANGFDITQLSTPQAQTDLLAAIHRGTSQIIQGTFIGERGAWAHNDVAKLGLQLRTFGLTAMEKQWGRTRAINAGGALNGYGYAAGVLLGQMMFAVPIYLARAGLYSTGREDQEEFLERATSLSSLAAATMNYSAMSGLAGDAFDLVASLGGSWNEDVKASLGGRSYGGGVGSAVPALGSIDAAWRVLSGKATLHTALKQLWFSNLPGVANIINLTAEDD